MEPPKPVGQHQVYQHINAYLEAQKERERKIHKKNILKNNGQNYFKHDFF